MKYTLTFLLIIFSIASHSQYFKDAGKQVIDSSRGSNLFPKKKVGISENMVVDKFTGMSIGVKFFNQDYSTHPIINPYIQTDSNKIGYPHNIECYTFEIMDGLKIVAYQKCNNDTIVIIDSLATIKQLLFLQLQKLIPEKSTITNWHPYQ